MEGSRIGGWKNPFNMWPDCRYQIELMQDKLAQDNLLKQIIQDCESLLAKANETKGDA